MGKVSIWAQWLIIAAAILLSPLFVLFLAWLFGWPHIRGLSSRREKGPGS